MIPCTHYTHVRSTREVDARIDRVRERATSNLARRGNRNNYYGSAVGGDGVTRGGRVIGRAGLVDGELLCAYLGVQRTLPGDIPGGEQPREEALEGDHHRVVDLVFLQEFRSLVAGHVRGGRVQRGAHHFAHLGV